MEKINRKQIGRMGLAMAVSYFTSQGYTISLPLNDTQWYDLIIEKNGIFETVQCKATTTEQNNIELKSHGGTNGSAYDSILNHTNLNWLFCVNGDLNMWLIPIDAIIKSGNTKQISLRHNPTTNRQGFQTYEYEVFL